MHQMFAFLTHILPAFRFSSRLFTESAWKFEQRNLPNKLIPTNAPLFMANNFFIFDLYGWEHGRQEWTEFLIKQSSMSRNDVSRFTVHGKHQYRGDYPTLFPLSLPILNISHARAKKPLTKFHSIYLFWTLFPLFYVWPVKMWKKFREHRINFTVCVSYNAVAHGKYFISINNRQIRFGDGKLDAMRFDNMRFDNMRLCLNIISTEQKNNAKGGVVPAQMRNTRSVYPRYASESLSCSHWMNVVNQPFLKTKVDDTLWNIWWMARHFIRGSCENFLILRE